MTNRSGGQPENEGAAKCCCNESAPLRITVHRKEVPCYVMYRDMDDFVPRAEHEVFKKIGEQSLDYAPCEYKKLKKEYDSLKAVDRDRQENGDWWTVEPHVGRVAHGIPSRVDRLRGLGNAVVPVQAREAFERLMGFKVPEKGPAR